LKFTHAIRPTTKPVRRDCVSPVVNSERDAQSEPVWANRLIGLGERSYVCAELGEPTGLKEGRRRYNGLM
jgi:hypothetical protein